MSRFHEGIKHIELVFENCETAIIPREYIGYVLFDGYKRSFGRQAMNWIGITENYEFVTLEISGDYKSFGGMSSTFGSPLYAEDATEEKINSYLTESYERIQKYSDITGIHVVYEDDLAANNFSFHPEWSDDEYSNAFQSVKVNELGDLLLTIASPEVSGKYSEVIDRVTEDFNSSDKFRWELMSI